MKLGGLVMIVVNVKASPLAESQLYSGTGNDFYDDGCEASTRRCVMKLKYSLGTRSGQHTLEYGLPHATEP